jgi:hypothetical protein
LNVTDSGKLRNLKQFTNFLYLLIIVLIFLQVNTRIFGTRGLRLFCRRSLIFHD